MNLGRYNKLEAEIAHQEMLLERARKSKSTAEDIEAQIRDLKNERDMEALDLREELATRVPFVYVMYGHRGLIHGHRSQDTRISGVYSDSRGAHVARVMLLQDRDPAVSYHILCVPTKQVPFDALMRINLLANKA